MLERPILLDRRGRRRQGPHARKNCPDPGCLMHPPLANMVAEVPLEQRAPLPVQAPTAVADSAGASTEGRRIRVPPGRYPHGLGDLSGVCKKLNLKDHFSNTNAESSMDHSDPEDLFSIQLEKLQKDRDLVFLGGAEEVKEATIQLEKLQKQSVRDRDLVFVERAEEVKEAKRAAKEAWRLAKRATKEAKRLAKRAAKLAAREADRLKARSSQSESTIA
jgi:hypothetical protein